jgi:acetate kinase
MQDTLLVVNCGSSSLKIALFDKNRQKIVSMLAGRLNTPDARYRIGKQRDVTRLPPNTTHQEALTVLVDIMRKKGLMPNQPAAIGHRVVHGGETFREAVLIDDEVLAAIAACSSLAPLHNPVNFEGIMATRKLFPLAPQVAMFDTAFHQTLPEHAFHYALPQSYYRDWGVRRYGFHGISHAYMLQQAALRLEQSTAETSIISAHLGNGCSITAIRDGKSVDTSMGLTPLEGLAMGTRSGDVDPGLFDYLQSKGMSAKQLHNELNHSSGLLGLSGQTNDMRTLSDLADQGDPSAQLAINVFCFRLAKYVAAMMASLNRLDALVFTGGIGQNSARVRQQTVSHLALLGFAIDGHNNDDNGLNRDGRIDCEKSRFPILVIATDEERVIAGEAARLAKLN